MDSVITELQSAIQQLSEKESARALDYVRSLRANERDAILQRFANRPAFRLPKPVPKARQARQPIRFEGKPASQILIEDRR